MATKTKDILGQAMLVNVHIGLWTARKFDKGVTEKTNNRLANGNNQAGRYHKRLFGGNSGSHGQLVTSVHVARRAHAEHTLPWEDSGYRLLPTSNYFKYTEVMRECKERYELALEKFLDEYDTLCDAAQEHLGPMYREKDYPTRAEVANKFHFNLQFSPVPSAGDFRVELPTKELKDMEKSVTSRVQGAVDIAMAEVWERLGGAVSELREKLDDGKYLRAAMVSRVGEVAETLGRLNIANDPKLTAAHKRVVTGLASLDVEALKSDDQFRAKAAAEADDILKKMKGLYTPTPKEGTPCVSD